MRLKISLGAKKGLLKVPIQYNQLVHGLIYHNLERVKSADQKVLKFKGTIIRGWTGLYETNLPEPYFRLAYDAGFGSKNAAGFGMVGVAG